jgi:hypothetical protein
MNAMWVTLEAEDGKFAVGISDRTGLYVIARDITLKTTADYIRDACNAAQPQPSGKLS